jgi:uncharacterized protein
MGRVAVVTGGSSGIGAAIARALARDGWQCILLARGEDRLKRVAAEIGGEYALCDVRDREAVERTAEELRARHPAIGLLVNNAGIPGRSGFLEMEPEQIEDVLRTNYLGSVWCLRAFLPALEAGAPSAVVNNVSVEGAVAFPPVGPYAASKHAQLAFSRALAAQLPSRGISVHTVNAGWVETEGFPQRTTLRPGPLHRAILEPDAVARLVLRMIARDRREAFIPWWFRPIAAAQGAFPGLFARVLGRAGGKGIRVDDGA